MSSLCKKTTKIAGRARMCIFFPETKTLFGGGVEGAGVVAFPNLRHFSLRFLVFLHFCPISEFPKSHQLQYSFGKLLKIS